MLFNEPKLLKCLARGGDAEGARRFSALQRAEIAEIPDSCPAPQGGHYCFSALQRAEIAEILALFVLQCFTKLQFQCSSTSRNC